MRIRALVTFETPGGSVPPGEDVDIDEVEAASLVARGLAEPVTDQPKPQPRRKPRHAR